MLPEELIKIVEAEANWRSTDGHGAVNEITKHNFTQGCEFVYQHISGWVEGLIKTSISETIQGMQEWIEKDTVIRSKSTGEIIEDSEIDIKQMTVPGSLITRIYSRLEKHGIKINPPKPQP